jgi:rSAM/selenodomain-associated transferase 2/rSAM/selenodomain-associated transferase 1
MGGRRPLTSLRIVMPVLQEGQGLLAALQALQPLRGQGAELVVVDGGSTDGSWAIARRWADEVRLAPRGRASQMNAGAAGCRAGALLFLHGDTRLPPGAGAAIAQALARGHGWGRFDVRLDSSRPLLRLVSVLMNARSRLTGIATGDQALFVRRELFERLGGFAGQPLMEDIELSRRLRRTGAPACLPGPAITSARRWESHGAWRTIWLMWRLRAAYYLGAPPQSLARRYGYRPPEAPAPAAAIAVLAKAPVPGLAKTRLAPLLGPAGAARAQRRFILETLHTARAAALGRVTLWCAPDAQQRFFRVLRYCAATDTRDQPAGDLGARMAQAVQAHFGRDAEPLLLIGTDCAVLAPGHLQRAARALQTHDAVLLPAEDGGYALLGLRRPLAGLFEGVAWSTGQVLAQTRERLRTAGARWEELAPVWDVDEPADWRRRQALLGEPDEQRI